MRQATFSPGRRPSGGWATWRRAWAQYDAAMARWIIRGTGSRPLENAAGLNTASPASASTVSMRAAWTRWHFGWAFAMPLYQGVSVMPTGNLVSNIGFDSEATHTRRPSLHEGAVRDAPGPSLQFGTRQPHPGRQIQRPSTGIASRSPGGSLPRFHHEPKISSARRCIAWPPRCHADYAHDLRARARPAEPRVKHQHCGSSFLQRRR